MRPTLDKPYEELLRLRLKVARAEHERAEGDVVRATTALLVYLSTHNDSASEEQPHGREETLHHAGRHAHPAP